jgi:hypothetical protein
MFKRLEATPKRKVSTITKQMKLLLQRSSFFSNVKIFLSTTVGCLSKVVDFVQVLNEDGTVLVDYDQLRAALFFNFVGGVGRLVHWQSVGKIHTFVFYSPIIKMVVPRKHRSGAVKFHNRGKQFGLKFARTYAFVIRSEEVFNFGAVLFV